MSGDDSEEDSEHRSTNEGEQPQQGAILEKVRAAIDATIPATQRRFAEAGVLALYFWHEARADWPDSHSGALFYGALGTCVVLLIELPFRIWWRVSAGICVACLLVFMIVGPASPTKEISHEAPPASPSPPVVIAAPMVGWLQPANEPTPENGCSSHGIDSPVVIMGDNGVMLGGVTKATALKVGNCPLVGLQIGDNGASIAATIYDFGGKIIGKIENNRFSIPPADGLVIEKSGDLSTLVVHNAANQELLYVRYLNKTAFRVRGIFSCPSPRPLTVRITDAAISGAPMRMSCVRWNGSGEAMGAAFSIQ